MDAIAIIGTMAARSIRLSLADNGLIRAQPASRLTDADRQAIREHRAELLSILSDRSAPTPETVPEVEEPAGPRPPDPRRGPVYCFNERRSCSIQSPVQPIPPWVIFWAGGGRRVDISGATRRRRRVRRS